MPSGWRTDCRASDHLRAAAFDRRCFIPRAAAFDRRCIILRAAASSAASNNALPTPPTGVRAEKLAARIENLSDLEDALWLEDRLPNVGSSPRYGLHRPRRQHAAHDAVRRPSRAAGGDVKPPEAWPNDRQQTQMTGNKPKRPATNPNDRRQSKMTGDKS